MSVLSRNTKAVLLGGFILIFALLSHQTAEGQSLTSIDVTPANPSISVGQTQQFSATGIFSDSSIHALNSPAEAVAAGNDHTCALFNDGTVKCWGNNDSGQLGNGTTTGSLTPVDVSGITTATAIAAGNGGSCAVLSDGTVKCWGNNNYGQLGIGTNVGPETCLLFGSPVPCSSTPVTVSGISTATAVAVGWYHTCALLSDGHIKCWGFNASGQLGNGTTTNSFSSVTVSGISTITAIAITAGSYHTCALFSGGPVKCWGDNLFGNLGNGTLFTNSSTPVSVSGITTATTISAGWDHTCVVLSNGSMSCWGYNQLGTLGNGTITYGEPSPVNVSGITTAAAVAAGGDSTCALLSDSTVQCWGGNAYGELGDGSTTDSSSPVGVVGLGAASSISMGGFHTCAILPDGTFRCWGGDSFGQLGDGGTTNSPTPVMVSGIFSGVVWSSSNTAVAPIATNGLATGLSPGSTTVTATSGSISGFSALTVVNSNQPDLIISALSTTTMTTIPGGSLSLSNTVKNQGTASAGSSVVAFHLSTNTVFGDADDVAFTAIRSVGTLTAGASSSANTTLTVPSSMLPGIYYLCATADSGSTVTESDETNNTLCTTSTITVASPIVDLVVSGLSTSAKAVAPGKTFTVTNTVTNQGTSTAGSSVVAFHLSTNTVFGDADDIAFITTRSVGSMAAGASSTATTTLTVPSTAPVGNYVICAKADNSNTVAESDETNNTRCTGALTIQVIQDQRWNGNQLGIFLNKLGDNGGNPGNPRQDGVPDFMIDEFCNSTNCGAVNVYSGRDRSLIFQITGTGYSYPVDAGDLNGDGIPDLFVGSGNYGRAQVYSGLDGSPIPGFTFNKDSDGLDFGICVSAIGDITGDGVPDLIVGDGGGNYVVLYSGADGSRIKRINNPDGGYSRFGDAVSEAGDVNGDGIPDFIVGAQNASPGGLSSAGSAFVFSGQRDGSGNFPVLYRLDGEHAGDSFGGCCGAVDSVGDINGDGKTDLVVAAWLADRIDVQIIDGNVYVQTFTDIGSIYLFDGATGTPLQRPDGLGPMRFDGEAAGDKLGGGACGCGWISKVGDINGDGYQDFMAGATGANGGAGRVLIFSGYDASVLLRIDNPDPNHTPRPFGFYGATLGDLDGDGAIEILIGAGLLGSGQGSVYLFSITPRAPINVTLSDLVMTNVTPNAATVNQGATLSVTNTVKNQGLVSTYIGFRVGYYLHPSAGSDVAITTTRSVAAMAAGASSTATTNLTIPAMTPPNDYQVCAKADSASAVVETNETNNTLCSSTQVTVPQPDLTVTAVSKTVTTVKAGGSFYVSNSIKNQGGSKAGSSVVAFHLSTDTTFGGGDDVASVTTRTITSLAINATNTASTLMKVPASTPPATYYVCIQADRNNSVAEVDEGNNDRCTTTTITVTP